MIACFLSNISAKYYKNSAMLSRVIAKNVGDVFFETQCRLRRLLVGFRTHLKSMHFHFSFISFPQNETQCADQCATHGMDITGADDPPGFKSLWIAAYHSSQTLLSVVRATQYAMFSTHHFPATSFATSSATASNPDIGGTKQSQRLQ